MTFSEEDVKTVVENMGRVIRNEGIRDSKEVAGYVLKSVRVLKDRLPDRFAMKIIHDHEELPKPLLALVRSYVTGKVSQREAEKSLETLESSIRQHFFANRIAFQENLPDNVLATPQEFMDDLQEYLEQYLDPLKARTMAITIYKKSSKSTIKGIDIDCFLGHVAPFELPGQFRKLPLQIGGREPTPGELDVCYWRAVQKAAQELGVPTRDVDRDAAIKEYRRTTSHETDALNYRQSLDQLLIK